MKGNDLAACLVIVLGVGGTIVGSLLAPVNEPVTLPAVNPQPVMMETPAPEPTTTPKPTPEPTPTVETVHFSATGDDLIHDGIFLQAKERGGDHYDFDAAYAAMQGYYDQFDVNWLNQETLVNDEFAASGYPMFSTPGDITDALYDIGFRVFSLSNNHSYDKGAAGIDASREHWAAMPDDVVSMGFYNLETYDDYVYQTVNGITFGYLSYTEHTNGLPTPSSATYGVVYLSDLDIIEQQIAAMRPNCDVLVVSCHWGVEGSHDVEDSQRQMAQWLADKYYGAAGFTYGYSTSVSRHLALEFSLGIGYLTTEYQKYTPYEGSLVWMSSGNYTFIGPTKAKISLVWVITKKRGRK